jgi:hypothetical protein
MPGFPLWFGYFSLASGGLGLRQSTAEQQLGKTLQVFGVQPQLPIVFLFSGRRLFSGAVSGQDLPWTGAQKDYCQRQKQYGRPFQPSSQGKSLPVLLLLTHVL